MSSFHLPNLLSRYSDTAVFCFSISRSITNEEISAVIGTYKEYPCSAVVLERYDILNAMKLHSFYPKTVYHFRTLNELNSLSSIINAYKSKLSNCLQYYLRRQCNY